MNNVIKYCLYATYDPIANALGTPFISQNNATALRQLEQIKKQYKDLGMIGYEDLTIMYLGKYQITPTREYDKDNKIIAYNDIFTDTDNAYDLLNAFDKSIEKESEEKI